MTSTIVASTIVASTIVASTIVASTIVALTIVVSTSVASTREVLLISFKNIHDYESKTEQLKVIMCLLND